MAKAVSIAGKKVKNMVFYVLMMAFPVLQFLVFYIGVNFNSVLLAFRSYDTLSGEYSFVWFENFRLAVFDIFHSGELSSAWINSLIAYLTTTVVGVGLGLIFSFYIYKKLFLHDFFKVMLFLPSVVSAVVMAMLFKYFCERAYPQIILKLFDKRVEGLFANTATVLPMLLFYNVWVGLGTSILMYSGAMSGISESLSESARLDGCSLLQEFWYITIPMIYPTIVTFLVVNMVQVFTNQLHLFDFEGGSAEARLYTYGYYLFKRTQAATLSEYPYLAAMGLLFTVVIVPVTLLSRRLLNRFGPSV